MTHTTSMALLSGLALCLSTPALPAQRQSAAAITDSSDPRFVTEQTRKQGGVMPPEQLALIFDHLDHALKVFPAEQRIEGVTTLSFTTRAPIRTLILDLYPKYAIASIAIDGHVVPPSGYANPEGQLRIALPRPLPAGVSFTARVVRLRWPSARRGKAAPPGAPPPTAGIRGSTPRSGGGDAICSIPVSITPRSSPRPPTCTTPCRAA